jgi:hypothetical protein
MEEKMRMPPPLTEPPYKKENCWICWLENEKGEICDIEIYETFPDQPGKVYEYLRFRLGKRSFYDVGNCLHNWDEWDLVDIFHKFGFQSKWDSHETQIKFFKRLANIEEYAKKIEGYLRYHNPCYL